MASWGVAGATTLRPATLVNQLSGFCEWKGPAPVPPPTGVRITTGTGSAQRKCVLARLLTTWLKPQEMKSPNCISTIGMKPSRARPIAQPSAPDSMMGVLRTRALPNSATNPSVTLKTPPYSAMSWPRRTILSSRRMATRRASLIAST